ncbi:MAG: hypothetical protein J5881_00005 [Clostridia bacterium]|nr:hypothetical protein [Clostridia bacterium]
MTKFNLEKCKSGNKGITLIALIITIIVLLILAGITISALTGSDSAPAKANEAKQKNDIGAVKDEIALTVQNAQTEAYDDIYVKNNSTVSSTAATTTVGQRVINAVLEHFGGTARGTANANDTLTATATKGLVDVSISQAKDENAEISLTTRDFTQTGSISLNNAGVLTWEPLEDNNGTQQQGGGNQPVASNLTDGEKTALAANGMAELTGTAITNSNLVNNANIKAVLTGQVPLPVGYTYVEGTSTTLESRPDQGSWGVVIEDENNNQWVWVPANASDMYDGPTQTGEVKNNSVKVASLNNPDMRLLVADNNSEYVIYQPTEYVEGYEEYDEESGSSVWIDAHYEANGEPITINKKSKSEIIEGISRVTPDGNSGYREPAILINADYEFGVSYEDTAQAFVNDYNDMITSIEKYGGFYVGRYELSGSVDSPTVQSQQSVLKNTDWYNLYHACRNLVEEDDSTVSTMIWGCQWDIMCKWASESGDEISYNIPHSDRHTGSLANSGANSNDKSNNIYDIEGNCYEWTQEGYNR